MVLSVGDRVYITGGPDDGKKGDIFAVAPGVYHVMVDDIGPCWISNADCRWSEPGVVIGDVGGRLLIVEGDSQLMANMPDLMPSQFGPNLLLHIDAAVPDLMPSQVDPNLPSNTNAAVTADSHRQFDYYNYFADGIDRRPNKEWSDAQLAEIECRVAAQGNVDDSEDGNDIIE